MRRTILIGLGIFALVLFGWFVIKGPDQSLNTRMAEWAHEWAPLTTERARMAEAETRRAAEEARKVVEQYKREREEAELRMRAAEEARDVAERRLAEVGARAEAKRVEDELRIKAQSYLSDIRKSNSKRTKEEMKAIEDAVRDLAPRSVEPSIPCKGQTVCTPVSVFFGTDRKRADLPHRADFGPDRSSTLHLGRAIVTVPRMAHRRVGEIIVASNLERLFTSVPPEGNAAKHFTITARGVHVFDTADEFVAAVREHVKDAGEFQEHAFVFVHGFRTTFEDGLYRVAQIAYDLAGSDGKPFGTAFLYSWPSGGYVRDYAYDLESAQFSVPHLRKYVELVIEQSGAKHVHLIAHSMGNRALLAALDEIAQSTKSPTTINQIILAAPDFDADQFAKVVERIVPMAKGVTLYASANDVAMKAAREVYRGVYRAGDVPTGGPVVVTGVDTIDISAISMDVIALGHSEYAERRELLNDIALLLRKGERPPHQRTPMFKLIQADKGKFWRVLQ